MCTKCFLISILILGRLELVGKTMKSDDNIEAYFGTIFKVLHENVYVSLTKGCSTHIHVSVGPNGEDKVLYTAA